MKTISDEDRRLTEALAASFRHFTGRPIYVSQVLYAEMERLGIDTANVVVTKREGGQPGVLMFTVTAAGRAALAKAGR